MAKIVVADDNSNIQRMVGLALKDQGIEVVAVGNGEAAVRKISELRPDLVLADVFMPVRNGYEVCQYVKEDSNLAHIPVILLVGAFDPLDESEAQRVGADGVLKKPFVPPDPLIAMVKAVLQKAGISLTPPSQEKTAPPPPRRAADLLSPSQPPTHVAPPPRPASPLAGIAFSGSQPFAPVVTDESFVSEPAKPEPVKIEEASSTMAFGDLLRPTTTQEEQPATQQDDSVDDVETVTGADWRSLDEPADVPEEEEENSDSAPSWRRDGGDAAFKFDDSEGPSRDWRDSPVLETAGRKSARETWDSGDAGGFSSAAEVPAELGAFATELNALEAESVTAAIVQEPPPVIEPTVQETQQVQTLEEPVPTAAVTVVPESEPEQEQAAAEVPQTVSSTQESVVEHSVEPAAPVSESQISEQATQEVASESVAAPVSSLTETTAAAPATEHLPEQAPQEQKPAEAPNSWFSRPASPWDAETRASTLATSWDSLKAPAAATRADEPQEAATGKAQIDAQLATQGNTLAPVSEGQTPVSAASASIAPSEMDVLIAKVLAKMSPDALQAMTKELLKPVVAALVEEELKNKK